MAERTVLYIDLDALKKNYRTACSMTQARVCCVLKSNAYGHGSVPVARALADEGCTSFAVSCAREALELILNGIHGEILIMGPCEKEYQADLLGQNILFTVTCEEDIEELEESCRLQGMTCRVHLKIDTGFHRLGFDPTPKAAQRIAEKLEKCQHVHAVGLYSHLGLIDEELDHAQYRRLIAMQDYLRAFSIEHLERHICDSISLVRYPQWHMERVRIGAFLYGVRPSRSDQMPFECLETIRFATTISQIRQVRCGDAIGYGEERIDHDARIATLCAGYGDGYPRRLSNGKGSVLIAGKRAKVIGLICMDQMIADISGIENVQPGDEAVLLGTSGNESITAEDLAAWAGTISYEILCSSSGRVGRIYKEAEQERRK